MATTELLQSMKRPLHPFSLLPNTTDRQQPFYFVVNIDCGGFDMKYSEMRKEQQREFEEFSRAKMFFAFSKEQFADGLAKLGCTASELATIGCGGFVKNVDLPEFMAMNKRHSEQLKQAIADDPTGDGFIFDMFNVELANHEYSYTYEPDDAISACGLTIEDVQNNPALVHGLNRAMQNQMEVAE